MAITAIRPAPSDAARAYLQRGWSPIPIPWGEKRPAVSGWQHLQLTEPDLAQYFVDPSNVGLRLGQRSGHLVDIDLDACEALAAADWFLPATRMVHGRPGKPRSHRWYRALPIAPRTEQFRAPDGAMLFELRSTGAQTIVPPSQHPSGEPLTWAGCEPPAADDPAAVDAGELRTAVAQVAACALLARRWPAEGARHDTALAVAGMLIRGGWTEEAACAFVETAAKAAGDEERQGRRRDVGTTSRAIASERRATGAPTLAKLIGDEAVNRLGEWLGLGRRPAPVAVTPGNVVADIRDVMLEKMPAFDRFRRVAALVVAGLRAAGDFYRTRDSRRFFFYRPERRLYDVAYRDDLFCELVATLSGLNQTERVFDFVVAELVTRCSRNAPVVEVHTLSHYDRQTNCLAVADNAGGVWVRERHGPWLQGQNGDGGLLFLTDPDADPWVPDFDTPGGAPWFREQFTFVDGEHLSRRDQQTLIWIWLLHQFFPALRRTRLIPTFLGGQGSGKTSAARHIGRVLVGPRFQVTGLRFKHEDGFVASLTSRVVLAIDNADTSVPWLDDTLARYATGERIHLRQLSTPPIVRPPLIPRPSSCSPAGTPASSGRMSPSGC